MSQRSCPCPTSIVTSIATLLVVTSTVLGATGVRAATPERYEVDARIDADDGVVVLRETIVVRTEAGECAIRLWVYADRLAAEPDTLDDESWRWVYPGERDFGGLTVSEMRVDGRVARTRWERAPVGSPRGRDTAGADLVVDVPPTSAPATHTVTFTARLRVPDRFGRLGHDGDVLSLAAPWYPLVVGADDATRFRVPHVVRLRGEGDTQLFAGGRMLGASGEVRADAAYVPVLASDELFVRDATVDATRVRIVSSHALYVPRPPHAPGIDGIDDVLRIDVVGRIAEVARRARAALRALDPRLVPDELVVLMVPTRVELAATAPGVVLVSDRIYEILPIELVREFQDRALRRAMFRAALEPLIDRIEPPRDRGWADDLRAVLMSDLDEVRRRGRARTPEEILGFAAFHPTVDQLLYAPQVPFEDVYFGSIDEPDRFRDDPARARRPTARGRRILEAARDALGPARMRRFTSLLVRGDVGARAALATSAPELAARIDQWLDTPVLPVNYRLGRIVSTPSAGGYRHDVEVIRDGAARVEPVEVEVEDDDDQVVRGHWDGSGRRGHVVLHTRAPLDDARIDPRGRLPESPDVADGNPRADNVTTAPWKPPLLQAFGLDLALAEGRLDGLLDFAMRRRYDLERAIAARIESSAAGQELAFRYVLGVGPKLDTNARIGFMSFGIIGQRLSAGFSESGEGGWVAGLTMTGGWDTRRFKIDPRHGGSLVGSLRLAGVRRDDASLGATVTAGVRSAIVVPWSLRNATTIIAGAGYTFGAALPGQQQGLAGRFLLRGFESGELLGDGRVFAIIEHRYNLVTDLSWNALHIGWIRELQLAAWVAGGVLFGERLTGEIRGAAEVGGGLRFLFDWLGVQPGVLAVDVAVPLTRESADVVRDGVVVRQRSPFGLYISFDQMF